MKRSGGRQVYAGGRFGKMIEAIRLSRLSIKKSNTALFISIIALFLSVVSIISVAVVKSEVPVGDVQREYK